MPIVKMYGLPDVTPPTTFQNVKTDVAKAIAGVTELKITEESVKVFFVRDMFTYCRGNEIVIFIDGLLERQGRTEYVFNEVARTVGECIKEKHFVHARVECFVSLMPMRRYWSSPK